MDPKMNEQNWTELKGKIKSKWGKFTDQEVDSLKSDLSQLSGKIQKTYEIAKDQADHQYEEFKKSVQSLIGREPAVDTSKVNPTAGAVSTPPIAKAVEPAGRLQDGSFFSIQ